MLTGLILLAVMLAASALALVPRLLAIKSFNDSWQPIPNTAGTCLVPAGVTPAEVGKRLARAGVLLASHSSLPVLSIEGTLHHVNVQVVPGDSWEDSFGRKVGGMQIGMLLQTNLRMESLLHELAHAIESAEGGVTDETHTSWVEKGIFRADDAYRAWLAQGAP